MTATGMVNSWGLLVNLGMGSDQGKNHRSLGLVSEYCSQITRDIDAIVARVFSLQGVSPQKGMILIRQEQLESIAELLLAFIRQFLELFGKFFRERDIHAKGVFGV